MINTQIEENEISEDFFEKGKLYAKRMKSWVVYGPIMSRRAGISLWINPVKNWFLCNFDCVYCQYWRVSNQKGIFAEPNEVKTMLEARLIEIVNSKIKINSLSICGPTEPLLNPKISEIVSVVITLRNKYVPKIDIDLFTNASIPIKIPAVDKVFLKFDANFKKTNQSKVNIWKEYIIQNIINFDVTPRIIQSMWFKWESGNFSELYIEEYIQDIKTINQKVKIDLLQFYTLLYIPSVDNIFPCDKNELTNLAKRIKDETSIESKVFYDPVEIDGKIRF